MKHILLITAGTILAVSAIVFGFTYTQVNEERLNLAADLQYRTRLLADSLKESVEPNFTANSTSTLQKIVSKFADRERIVGLTVFNNRGVPLASSAGMPRRVIDNPDFVFAALDKNEPTGLFDTAGAESLYFFVAPLHQNERVTGALVVVQNASYIDANAAGIWKRNAFRLLIQIILFSIAVALLVRFALLKPLRRLADSIKSARLSKTARAPLFGGPAFFQPLASEIAKMNQSLAQARFSASEEARLRLEKLDSPWTAERLKEFIKAYLKNQEIFLVFTQEPYERHNSEGKTDYRLLANGVATAFEPLMEACRGMWVAQASGDVRKDITDESDIIKVPPDNPKYTLKRVRLTAKEERGYNKGYSIEGLYPLCLNTHTRPIFREEDWVEYKRVNEKFARVLLSEIKSTQRPIIIVNEYYFTLLPQIIKKNRPDAQVGIFWHTPWPSAEAFSICPQRKEILEGMLGADIIGFNTQQFCNNFIDTVGKNVESLLDFDKSSITREEHTSYIRSFPVSITFTNRQESGEPDVSGKKILKRLKIKTKYLGLGVDRLDYAKGIPERFKGIEYFFDTHPEYREQFTFLQIAAPDRPDIRKYIEYKDIVSREAERINKRFATKEWRPLVLETVQYSHPDINALYKLANVCIVTSLHDSMNLVSKEYAAARDDELGVLILSQFTGASHDLKGALIINPYSTKEIADAIHQGVRMLLLEQNRRMKTMRNSIKNYNIYRWAAELLKAVAGLG